MYCSQCAHNIIETDVYCPKCSKPVASFAFDDAHVAQVEPVIYDEIPTVIKARSQTPEIPAQRSGLFMKVIALLILLCLVIIAAALLTRPGLDSNPGVFNAEQKGPSNQPMVSEGVLAPTQEPTPEPIKVELVNTSIPVPARNFIFFPFQGSSTIRLTGGFVAYGGSRDITAMVLDEQNFQLYRNGHRFNTYYKVDRTDKAKLLISLAPGKYYLVFDNQHSFMTDKSVAAEVYVQYSP